MSAAARPIVIVDDDDDYVMVARLLLARLAPEAAVTAYGSRAEFLADMQGVARGALVLLDRCLGGSESFDLLPELVRRRPDLDTVMLSARLAPADRARALHAGAIDGAEKPDSVKGWRRFLDRVLSDEGAVRAA